jgi:hypothetical protein
MLFSESPNELRIDAAEGSEAEERDKVPPHQPETRCNLPVDRLMAYILQTAYRPK